MSAPGWPPGRKVDKAWFRFRHYHPAEALDAQTAFEAGYRLGGKDMFDADSRWAGLLEHIDALRDELIVRRIESEGEAEAPAGELQW
jgi:hypothetical protein